MTSSTRSGLGLAAGWRWVTLWLAIGWAALGQALPPAHAQGGATAGEPWLTIRVSTQRARPSLRRWSIWAVAIRRLRLPAAAH